MERIRQSAEELALRFSTRDPFALCQCLDIEVLWVELPANVKGFYTRMLGTKIIYLNADLSDDAEKCAVCAHELGHALLHEECNSLFLTVNTELIVSRFEKEADLFAGYLLLGGELAEECRREGWTAEQAACMTGLSRETVAYCVLHS